MQDSKHKSLVVRLVSGSAAGLLIVAGLFAVLFHVTDIPFQPGDRYERPPIDWTRKIIPRPPKPVIIVEIEKPPVPVIPEIPTNVPEGPGDPTEGLDRSPTRFPPDIRIGRGTGPDGPGAGTVISWGTDQDIVKIVGIPPEYPVRELTQGIEGWVRVQFTITAAGSVKDAVVVASEPEGRFDEAALTAIARWRYNPRVVEGEAVERVGVQTLIEFEITD
jgi:TonB family protein